MHEDVGLWLRKAKEDHKTALILYEHERWEDCAVYSHQSVEKSLKAFFLSQHGEVPKVHDITYLAKRLELPLNYINFCIKLTPAYFAGRYPDAPGYDEKLFIVIQLIQSD